MKRRTVALIIGMAVLACMFAFMPAFSQEDITSLKDPAFGEGQRPAAAFVHEEHNEKAEIEECSVCHHVHQDGELVEDESSEDQSCSECHNVKEGYPTPSLMKAYHTMCQGCHQEKGSGPITCGECHPRGGSPASRGGHNEGGGH